MISPFYDYKTGFSQTYFLSRVVKDAKRSPKISFFIQKNGLDALRWTNPIAVILQISRITSLLAALRALARLPLPRLSSRGSFPGSPFCHCGWHGPNREHSVLDPQRLDPTHPGPHRLPSSRHVEDFSVALQSQATPKSATGPRPTPSRTLPALGPSLQRHCRCRYHHTDHLRFSRRHSAGLHPQKTPWPAFLCPNPLQRGAQRFESGNGAQSRQHARLLWGLGFSGADFGEAALLDRFHSHPRSARWRLLRQKDRRIPRSKAPGLRYRCQNVPTVEEQDGPSSIPSVRSRLGSSRVYLHSLSLESRAPIRGRAKACGSGARRDPETAFHLQGLHLPPSFGHQLGADPGGGLALLLRPSFSGTVAPRAQGLLCNGQDSHAQLLGQRYLHGDALVGLRLGVGFPVSLPAKDSSALEHLHSAPRALVAACPMGQTGQSQPLDAPGEVSSSGTVPQNSAGRLENQTADLNRFATLLTARPLVGD